jgi:YbbR domain-containing protein
MIYDVFRRLWQKIKNSINKKFLTYLVFILIASVIWYLNALSKDYTDDLKFAVRYTDLPEDKLLTNSPTRHLTLTISAQGFTLLKYKLGLIFSPITMEASFNTLRKTGKPPFDGYYLLTQPLFNKIAAQLSPDVTMKQVSPDTVYFRLSETVRKEIPVKPTLLLQFNKEFLPTGRMIVKPEKVTVTGPKTVIDTMQYVYTRTKSFSKLKDTLRTVIALQPVHQLRYSVNEVSIVQAIERHTEASITVQIESVNVPEGLTMKAFPGTVTVNCMIPVSDYEKLRPQMFRAVVDYFTVKDAKDNQTKAKVTILRSPDNVTNVKIHPANVDYIIEK